MSKLVEILDYSRDGEWGKDSPFTDSLEMRVLRGTDFDKFHELNFSSLPTRHIAKKHAFNKQLIGNDIVLETAGGTQKKPTGRAVFITETALDLLELPVVCASFARVLRINPAKAFPEFVYWALRASYNDGTMSAFNTQHTGVSRFQYTEFSTRFELYLPEILTQKKIASVLSAYDDLIANNERRIKILEEMAQSIYREWFVNYRFPGHENVRMVDSELGEIPEGWETKCLGDICRVVPGYAFKSSEWQETGMPVIKIKNILLDNTVDLLNLDYVSGTHLTEKLNRYVLANGDLLVAMTGATAGKVGKFRSKQLAFLNQRVAKIEPLSPDLRNYIWCMISTEESQARFFNLADGAAQPNMSGSQIENVSILLPENEVTGKFDHIIQDLFAIVDSYIFRNSNLRQTRDLLLPKLISGELNVEELDIVAA